MISYIAEGIDLPLEPGMTFHSPISLRFPGTAGVGFSETWVVTEAGCEVLTELLEVGLAGVGVGLAQPQELQELLGGPEHERRCGHGEDVRLGSVGWSQLHGHPAGLALGVVALRVPPSVREADQRRNRIALEVSGAAQRSGLGTRAWGRRE